MNELLGFEVGDLTTGRSCTASRCRASVKGPVKRHGCPSHGIGLTPDEKEVWVVDAPQPAAPRLRRHAMPPNRSARITLRDEPGWVTFTLDGRFAYPSTGEVIDAKTHE